MLWVVIRIRFGIEYMVQFVVQLVFDCGLYLVVLGVGLQLQFGWRFGAGYYNGYEFGSVLMLGLAVIF